MTNGFLFTQLSNLISKKLVGERRFELPASWSRTKRATKLRYSPIKFYKYKIYGEMSSGPRRLLKISGETGSQIPLGLPLPKGGVLRKCQARGLLRCILNTSKTCKSKEPSQRVDFLYSARLKITV